MLTAVGLVPSAPLLVPELSGTGSPDVGPVRDATLEVGRFLAARADRWTVLTIDDTGSSKGTFRGFGVDVQVSLRPADDSVSDPMMSLPLLIGAWLRTQTAPEVTAAPFLVPPRATSAQCRQLGATLWSTLSGSPHREALLVVADGSTMLTPKAPGAFHPDAPAFQERLDASIESGDWASIVELEGWAQFGAGDSRPLIEVLAEVLTAMRPTVSRGTHCAPFGVGYLMRGWSA